MTAQLSTRIVEDDAAHGLRAQVAGLLAAGQAQAALALVLPQLRAGGCDCDTLSLGASCYWALEDWGTAIALMEVVVQNWPDAAEEWCKLAAMALSVGDKVRAKDCFKTGLRLDLGNLRAIAALNRIEPIARDSAMAGRLRSAARSKRVPMAQRVDALNALGHIEARAGRFRPAFRLFTQSNALQQARYRSAAFDAMLEVQRQVLRPAPGGSDPPRLIFICGMPRSGTTLVETTLMTSPGVRSIGESPALGQVAAQMAGACGGDTIWAWMAQCGDQDVAQARAAYLHAAGVDLAQDGTVLSKMPLDALHIGFAARILPEARFVVMRRHPLDTGLSNFMTNFHQGNGFSTRLDWIGHLNRIVHDITDDCAAKLGPGRVRLQSYRALVCDPDREFRALREFGGLKMGQGGPAAPHAVRTASLLQVREDINHKGLDRWHDYEAQLAPLTAALGGAEWLAAWEARDQAGWDQPAP